MKNVVLAAVTLMAVALSGCCGGVVQTFTLQKPTTTSASGRVLFELTAKTGFDPVTLSDESVVINKTGENSGNTVAPSPSPWVIELVTDVNADGKLGGGDTIRVVQKPDVAGGIEMSSGSQYEIVMLTHEEAQDAVHTPMTVVTWSSSWTVP